MVAACRRVRAGLRVLLCPGGGVLHGGAAVLLRLGEEVWAPGPALLQVHNNKQQVVSSRVKGGNLRTMGEM